MRMPSSIHRNGPQTSVTQIGQTDGQIDGPQLKNRPGRQGVRDGFGTRQLSSAIAPIVSGVRIMPPSLGPKSIKVDYSKLLTSYALQRETDIYLTAGRQWCPKRPAGYICMQKRVPCLLHSAAELYIRSPYFWQKDLCIDLDLLCDLWSRSLKKVIFYSPVLLHRHNSVSCVTVSFDVLRGVDLWVRKCVKTSSFLLRRRVFSPAPSALLLNCWPTIYKTVGLENH